MCCIRLTEASAPIYRPDIHRMICAFREIAETKNSRKCQLVSAGGNHKRAAFQLEFLIMLVYAGICARLIDRCVIPAGLSDNFLASY